jgi:hypothetical protein
VFRFLDELPDKFYASEVSVAVSHFTILDGLDES